MLDGRHVPAPAEDVQSYVVEVLEERERRLGERGDAVLGAVDEENGSADVRQQ